MAPSARYPEAKRRRLAAAPFAIVLAASLASVGLMVAGNTGLLPLWQAAPAGETQHGESADVGASGVDASVPGTAQPSSAANSPSAGAVVLGSCELASPSLDEDRVGNLALAVQSLDGAVIAPGEALSFNEAVGDVRQVAGYRIAFEIDDASTERVRGGGVGQLASALYVAALSADLQIAERHPHAVACDYAPAGQDADVSFGERDLVVANAGASPVTVHASAQGQTVAVSITGAPREDGSTFAVTSAIVPQQPSDAAGSYVVETRQVRYVDGVQQDSRLISTDVYQANATEISIVGQGAVAPSK